ncbi:MAG: ferritin-like domain-containing protein [Saprospiraceae bacterium]
MQKPATATAYVKADRNPNSRRNFLRYSGLGLGAAGLLMAGCDDDDGPSAGGRVNLGSGDLGILNFAYALEQLEAAFYAQVLTGSYYASANADERQILADLEAHERAHRDFFKAAISTVGTPIPDLEVDFSMINFNDRTSVLSTAQTFEDLGVSAYNGAGQFLQNADYLLIAGKIVSVEARHAAAIRSIAAPGNPRAFADASIVDTNGLDKARMPAEVLSMASAFIVTEIDASNLPG